LDKLIFCKVWDEKNTDKGKPYSFQIFRDDVPTDPTKTEDEKRKIAAEKLKIRIDALYNEGKKKDPEVFNKPIDLTPERMQTVVRYLQRINLNKTDIDSKGKAFDF
jgi:type I restriction enzyme M protein